MMGSPIRTTLCGKILRFHISHHEEPSAAAIRRPPSTHGVLWSPTTALYNPHPPGDELDVGFGALCRLLSLRGRCMCYPHITVEHRCILGALQCSTGVAPCRLHEPNICRWLSMPPTLFPYILKATLDACRWWALWSPATQLVVVPVSSPSTAPALHSVIQSLTCSQAPVLLSIGVTASATVPGATSNTAHVHQGPMAREGGCHASMGPDCDTHSTVPLWFDCVGHHKQ